MLLTFCVETLNGKKEIILMKYLTLAAFFGTSIALSLSLSASVQAQTMYRCGSVFQDRPCDNGQQGKIIGVNRAPGNADKPALDPSCTRRGDEAKKIIWSREGGASAEKLMAEATTGEARKLISDVYAIRANSSEVRAAIENACMAEKTRARQDGYMPDEDAPASPRNAERKTPATSEAPKRADGTDNTAARKRAQCDMLKSQLASNRNSQRAGGGGNTMNSLNQEKSELENVLKSVGCESAQPSMQMQ